MHCKHLGFSLYADLSTPLGLSLYRYGVTDPLAHWLGANLRPGDVVIDGGANIGLMTLTMARAVGPQGRVTAFEPADATRRLLVANIALNGFENTTTRGEALLDRSNVTVSFAVEHPGSGTAAIATQNGMADTVEVPAIRLDDVRAETRIALLKLDVEGAEIGALRGACRILTHDRPVIVVEVESANLKRLGGSVAELRDVALKAGYRGAAITMSGSQVREVDLPCDWSRPAEASENYVLRPIESGHSNARR